MRSLLPDSSAPREIFMTDPRGLIGPAVPLSPSAELLKRISEVELDGRSPETLYTFQNQVLLLDTLPSHPDYPGQEENVLRFWIARLAHLSSVPTISVSLSYPQNELHLSTWQTIRRAELTTRRATFADDNQLEAAAARRRAPNPVEEEEVQEAPEELPPAEDEEEF